MGKMPEKRQWVLARGGWLVFRRMIQIWAAAAAAAAAIVLCERAALGSVVHGRLAGNLAAVLAILGAVDGTVSLFQAGWFWFSDQGYGYHIPWRGSRGSFDWAEVDFAGLAPGETAMDRCRVALLLVGRDSSATALEYRRGMIGRLLALHPALRVAALPEDRAVARICRSLDDQDVGWMPLSWVQHADGSGELILRAKGGRPAEKEAGGQ